jgi:tetratricopeptide (TPR) repeat protein
MKILLIPLLITLTACSTQSPFEKDMRVGKDAYKAEKYEEALHYFEDALIEKPTDKDAAILLEKTKQKYNDALSEQAAQTYKNEAQPLYDEFIVIMDKYTDEYLENKDRIIRLDDLRNLEKLKNIQNKVQLLGSKYSDLKAISDINTSLYLAIKRFSENLNKEPVGILSKHFIKSFVSSFPKEFSKLTK